MFWKHRRSYADGGNDISTLEIDWSGKAMYDPVTDTRNSGLAMFSGNKNGKLIPAETRNAIR